MEECHLDALFKKRNPIQMCGTNDNLFVDEGRGSKEDRPHWHSSPYPEDKNKCRNQSLHVHILILLPILKPPLLIRTSPQVRSRLRAPGRNDDRTRPRQTDSACVRRSGCGCRARPARPAQSRRAVQEMLHPISRAGTDPTRYRESHFQLNYLTARPIVRSWLDTGMALP